MVARESMLYTWGGMCAALKTAAPGCRVDEEVEKQWIQRVTMNERYSRRKDKD